jgi:phosphate acetyltransferase
MGFIDDIKERARKNKKKIVLPETADVRIIKAAAEVLKEDIADLVLVGNKETILDDAKNYGYHLQGANIVDPENFEKLDSYIDMLVQLRQKQENFLLLIIYILEL